ncbi:Hypothetical predicted protein, partial [Mytilus galloprovincialis]
NPISNNNGRYFSTYDRDNDNWNGFGCAASYNGWWHGSSSNVFLNDDFSDGLSWGYGTCF